MLWQLLVMSWLVLGLPALAAESLTILAHELRPYCWQEQGRLDGYACEMVRETMQELGLQQSIKLTSFSRGQSQVLHASNIAFLVYSRAPEREKTVQWVGPILESDVYLYKRKGDKLTLNSLDDLRNVRAIGVQRSIRDESALLALGLKNLYYSNSREMTLRALLNRRVDVIPMSVRAVNSLLRNEGVTDAAIENTGLKLYDSEFYVAFSKNVDDDTIRRWQHTLDKVRQARQESLAHKYLD